MGAPKEQEPESSCVGGGVAGWRKWRPRWLIVLLALVVILSGAGLAVHWYLAQRSTPSGPPLLPHGCEWVREPPAQCPTGDPAAYQKYVKANGPLVVRDVKSGIELVFVPGGSFRMGSDEGNRDERPVHRVRLDSFWIGRTEVTVREWRSLMGSLPGADNDQGDDHPVVDVSWQDCERFCRQAGLALPTEAQWEYAARGPEEYTYPWGDWWAGRLCRSAETRRRKSRTAPVGSFPLGASWCGALDMAGNVAEWCQDWYAQDFYASASARRPNPECQREDSGYRVLRGGSWFNYADSCRTTGRSFNFPWLKDFDIGLRVVLNG